MNKDSRVNIARKVLQDGKLPVDEGNPRNISTM